MWIEIKALRRMPVCPYVTSRAGVWIEMVTTAIPLALDGGLRQPKVAVCAILSLWGHGNQKTDTNIYYNTILSLYANTEKNY